MAHTENSTGILPGDLILQTALQAGLADLRRDPTLLDDIFATLVQDDESAQTYGVADAAEAKRWFQNTDVPVRLTNGLEPPSGTCLSVQLADGHEDEMTTGDVHYQRVSPVDLPWPALAGPLTPASYDPATGTLVLPNLTLVVVPGMTVVDRTGAAFPVVDVPAQGTLVLGPGVQGDFVGAVIKGARPAVYRDLASIEESETWQVGVHVVGEPVYLSYLFPIVRYTLYRLREDLEGRGLEQVRYAWTGVEKDSGWGVENLFSRYLTITSKARATWVRRSGEVYTAVNAQVVVKNPFGDDAMAVVGP